MTNWDNFYISGIQELLTTYDELTDNEICRRLYDEKRKALTLEGFAMKYAKYFKKRVYRTGRKINGLRVTKNGLVKVQFPEKVVYFSLKVAKRRKSKYCKFSKRV